jgi:hypothetical protein
MRSGSLADLMLLIQSVRVTSAAGIHAGEDHVGFVRPLTRHGHSSTARDRQREERSILNRPSVVSGVSFIPREVIGLVNASPPTMSVEQSPSLGSFACRTRVAEAT